MVGECSANSRRCGWDGERAQPEAISEKMGIFQWSRKQRLQAGNHNRLKLQLEVCASGSDPGQNGSVRVRERRAIKQQHSLCGGMAAVSRESFSVRAGIKHKSSDEESDDVCGR